MEASTKTVSAAHVSSVLKAGKFEKYTEERSAVRGFKSRYSGFKVTIGEGLSSPVMVTYLLGNDHAGWEFNNNRPGTIEARAEAVAKKIASYSSCLLREGYISKNHGNYLIVTSRLGK